MTATVIENNVRTQRKALAVYELGRRVHGWELLHDVLVDCLYNFPAYWDAAQANYRGNVKPT